MKRRTTEQIKPKHPTQIWAGCSCSPKERLFVLLCLLGYSKTRAYQIAISPNAKASSSSVAACNLAKEQSIQRAAHLLFEAYVAGEWELNTSILRFDM